MASPHRGRPFDNRQSSPTGRASASASTSPSRVACTSPLHSREAEAKRSAPPLPQSFDNRRKGVRDDPARHTMRWIRRSRQPALFPTMRALCAAVGRGAQQRRPAPVAGTASAPAPVAPQRSEELDAPRGSKFEQAALAFRVSAPVCTPPRIRVADAAHSSSTHRSAEDQARGGTWCTVWQHVVPYCNMVHCVATCDLVQERIKREEKRESLRKEMRLLWDQQVLRVPLLARPSRGCMS